MISALARRGVALKILAGLLLLVLFSIVGGIVAILSFKEANQAFSLVASKQIATMSDAAVLRQHTQAISSLAPGLFARELDDGALLAFTSKMFSQQIELQQLIDKIAGQIGDSNELAEINETASALFDNVDALSTAIYSKAALQQGIDQQVAEITSIRDAAHAFLRESGPAEASALRDWMAALDGIAATALDSLAYKRPNGLAPLQASMTLRLQEASQATIAGPSGLQSLHDRLSRIVAGQDGFVRERARLLETEIEIEDLFHKNEAISAKLSAAADIVADGVQAEVVDQGAALTATLTDRSRLLLLLGALGLAGALGIGAFTQMSVIGRLHRLRRAMTGSDPLESAHDLTKGQDEISEMARAVVNYVAEISRRDEAIKRSGQRLTAAIETLPSGFSLYDSEDKLVVCNSRYRRLLYPGIEGIVQAGQSFEMIVRKAIEHGLIRSEGDVNLWLAERVKTHRQPHGVTLQQRSDGAWIDIRERRVENGDIVSIYTDVTERKNFEAQLVEAREAAERAKELADERSRMMERLSEKLSKYLSPQVYSTIFTSRSDIAISSSRKKLTIFFADIADFAETTDSLESEELTALLNHYLTEMSEIALRHGATIDKYIGDAIMTFFGDPETRGVREDASACVAMAIAMQRRMRQLESEWRARGVQRPFRMRIGINTGFCTVGNFGSENRMDYTIIGSEVNLAARLQANAELGGILLAHETQALIQGEFPTEELAPIRVKGFAHPIRVYRVDGIREGAEQQSLISAKMDGAELRVDISRLSSEDRHRLADVAQALISRLKN